MNKYIWLNVAYLGFYILALIVFSNNKTGGGPFVGGALVLLVIFGAGLIGIYAICIGIMFFTKGVIFIKVVTTLSSVLVASILVLYIWSTATEQIMQRQWRRDEEEAQRRENSPEGIKHREFVQAIYSNDSIKVKQLADEGVKATDEDLSIAIQQVFESDNEISVEIFKVLISSGANVRNCPPSFTNNRFCKNFEIVKVLLDAGASPIPEGNSFPFACLEQLKLLLQYVPINTPTRISYPPNRNADVGSSLLRTGTWTPIMVYLYAYPYYFEETKFLLTQKPDLKYKDEYGYSLRQLLTDIVVERKSKGEPVEELIEFEKKIQ